MPDKYNVAFPDPSLPLADRAVPLHKLRHKRIEVNIEAADDVGQKYYAVKLPGTAVLSAASTRRHGALTGATDIDFGDALTPDGLIDGASWASAAAAPVPLFGASPDAVSWTKPLWELLGHPSNPGDIDLYFTMKADVSGAGVVEVDLLFSLPE